MQLQFLMNCQIRFHLQRANEMWNAIMRISERSLVSKVEEHLICLLLHIKKSYNMKLWSILWLYYFCIILHNSFTQMNVIMFWVIPLDPPYKFYIIICKLFTRFIIYSEFSLLPGLSLIEKWETRTICLLYLTYTRDKLELGLLKTYYQKRILLFFSRRRYNFFEYCPRNHGNYISSCGH